MQAKSAHHLIGASIVATMPLLAPNRKDTGIAIDRQDGPQHHPTHLKTRSLWRYRGRRRRPFCAHLKFLGCKRQIPSRNFKWIGGTRIVFLLVPLAFRCLCLVLLWLSLF